MFTALGRLMRSWRAFLVLLVNVSLFRVEFEGFMKTLTLIETANHTHDFSHYVSYDTDTLSIVLYATNKRLLQLAFVVHIIYEVTCSLTPIGYVCPPLRHSNPPTQVPTLSGETF